MEIVNGVDRVDLFCDLGRADRPLSIMGAIFKRHERFEADRFKPY